MPGEGLATTEIIVLWRGVGRFMYGAILFRDYPVILAGIPRQRPSSFSSLPYEKVISLHPGSRPRNNQRFPRPFWGRA